ncbi:MAG TPA: hypothetical protein VJV96_10530 [Candidatus Angelobacter sp.]|jgi:hypothetical protein|nr:hypothetical protein [Candidatus Angelobacter sp.]
MHKSRWILLSIIMISLAAPRIAKAQDGTANLYDQIQNKYSEREPDKPITTHQQDKTEAKNNEGHRKHWWSLPHFHHKRKDEKSASQLKGQPRRNTVTVSSQAVSKPAAQKHIAGQKHVAKNSAPAERSSHKTLTAAKPTHRTVAKSKTSTVAAAKVHKKTVASSGHAKEVHQNCSSAAAKKDGCQNVRRHTGKTATRSS